MSQSRARAVRRQIKRGLEGQGLDAEGLRAAFDKKVADEWDATVNAVVVAVSRKYEARQRARPRYCPHWLWSRIVARVIAPPTVADPPKFDDVGVRIR